MGFLEPYEQRLLVDASGKFRVSLYKTLLFIKIAEAIKAGTLNLKHSYKYRSLDDYLIHKAAWDAHRDDYLHRADLLAVADCQQTLQTLAGRLDQQYQQTNQPSAGSQSVFSSSQGRLVSSLHTQDTGRGQRTADASAAPSRLHLPGRSPLDSQPAHGLSRCL